MSSTANVSAEQMTEIEKIISTKLAVIDILNKDSEGKQRSQMRESELAGIKQVLYVMGYELFVNANPYFHQNGEASTFSIKPVSKEAVKAGRHLRILKSKDASMWYAGLVGTLVPYCGKWPEAFKSREPAGHINRVEFGDAEIVDVLHDGTVQAVSCA